MTQYCGELVLRQTVTWFQTGERAARPGDTEGRTRDDDGDAGDASTA